MGTQQILLIVLGVIIVGVAIAVGITMFTNQAYNSNQQALSGELQHYASQCIQYYKTPSSQGGAAQQMATANQANMSSFIGFSAGSPYSATTDNGEFRITAYDNSTGIVTLVGLGNENKGGNYPKVTTTVNLTSSTIVSSIGADDTF